MAYLGELQTYNPRAWVQLSSNFWLVVNPPNLTNLFSHNPGKTPLPAATLTRPVHDAESKSILSSGSSNIPVPQIYCSSLSLISNWVNNSSSLIHK